MATKPAPKAPTKPAAPVKPTPKAAKKPAPAPAEAETPAGVTEAETPAEPKAPSERALFLLKTIVPVEGATPVGREGSTKRARRDAILEFAGQTVGALVESEKADTGAVKHAVEEGLITLADPE